MNKRNKAIYTFFLILVPSCVLASVLLTTLMMSLVPETRVKYFFVGMFLYISSTLVHSFTYEILQKNTENKETRKYSTTLSLSTGIIGAIIGVLALPADTPTQALMTSAFVLLKIHRDPIYLKKFIS